MTKKIITQSERTTLFNEWLKDQPMPKLNELVERQRWWVNKVLEHDKLIHQEYDIVPGFYVDGDGKVIYDDNKGEE